MAKAASEDRITKLEDEGIFLYVYSDKQSIFFLFQHLVDKKLYKITTNKDFVIESIDEISTDKCVFNEGNVIRFFKPLTPTINEYVFTGIITLGVSGTFRFFIQNDKFTFGERIDAMDLKINLMKCTKGIQVISYIQKRGKIYLIGNADEGDNKNHPIFAIADIESDQFEQVYYIYSDKGPITLNSIGIDVSDMRVYVVGGIEVSKKRQDSHSVVKVHQGFCETFMLRT